MQVVNSVHAYVDSEYHNTTEAFFEGAEEGGYRLTIPSWPRSFAPSPLTSMVREGPGLQDYLHCCMYFISTVQL